MTADPIRLLCVDDHRIVREGIALVIGREPDMQVVGLAASGEESVEHYRTHRPDVTLMDLQLEGDERSRGDSGHPDAESVGRIVVLTMSRGDEDIYRALQAGAVTYLSKTRPSKT